MKKQLTIGLLSFAAILFINTQAKAQADETAGTATVNIELTKFSSIDNGSGISSGDNTINFVYDTPTAYNSIQEDTKEAHLIITSADDFSIKVKGTGDGTNFDGGSSTTDIPLDVLSLQASSEDDNPGTMTAISLSNVDQTLIASATLGASKTYDVRYFIPAEKATGVLLGKDAGTYTATITYTITAP